MEIHDVHAPRNEDDVDLQSVTPISLDDGDQLSFESLFLNRWSGYEYGDPLIDGLQTYLSQPAYVPPGEYAGDELTSFPVVDHFHQNVGHNEEYHGSSSLLSSDSEWFQYESIPGLYSSFYDAEGNQHAHHSPSLANNGQDVMIIWEDIHCVSSAGDSHHPAIVGGDVMDNGQAPTPIPSCSLRCQHHNAQGQPCGMLIEGEIADILEHFARMHVCPRISPKYWTCRWGGQCGKYTLKEGFKRHILGHLARWECSACSSTFSRGDTARKHARHCGNGRIFMKRRSEVQELFQLNVPVYL
ncbi:hypothetical protein BDR04DRAFT_1160644 [Suillus decipiens]|nr:hypothetical protein BDR04DRAFT_1160644 [Suillus decipiens]